VVEIMEHIRVVNNAQITLHALGYLASVSYSNSDILHFIGSKWRDRCYFPMFDEIKHVRG